VKEWVKASRQDEKESGWEVEERGAHEQSQS
jgi:hypothetical protein